MIFKNAVTKVLKMLKNITKYLAFLLLFALLFIAGSVVAQDHNHKHDKQEQHNHDDHNGHDHDAHKAHDHAKHDAKGHEGHNHGGGAHASGGGHGAHGGHVQTEEEKKDYATTVMNHINDANEIHILGNFTIPLPCILYAKDKGLDVFMSSKFHHGHNSYKGYVSYHGNVKRVKPGMGFPQDKAVDVHVDHFGKFVTVGTKKYPLEEASALTGMSSWFDFSISKAVTAMLLASFLLFFIFRKVARSYQSAPGTAPKGIQAVFEPIIVYLTDNVIKPIIGPKYIKYSPFLLTLFFFILTLNLLGLIPGFGFNATGNLAVTLALAVITLLVYVFNGNKHYWEHMLWMPGLPFPMKILMALIEGASNLILKPATLMLRLFANITGGHIVILSLVGLVWAFGNFGESLAGGLLGGFVSTIFVLFMNVLELLVGFLQAFIFMTLATVYIAQAVEEPHHEAQH